MAVNTLPWQVHQIINLKEDCDEPTRKRMRVEGEMNEAAGGGHYVAVEMQGIGWSKLTPINPPAVKVCKLFVDRFVKFFHEVVFH